MGLQHDNQNPPGNESLRAQRMTADEAASVIALWQQERVEQTGPTDRPALPDVAEGLDIPVEEVQRLLAAVRARRREEERALAQEQAETRLAEEERRLAEVRRQRVELRRGQVNPQKRAASRSRWVETKPGVWEDVNQSEPSPLVSPGVKAGAVILCLIWSTVVSVLACLGWMLGSWGPQLTQ